MVGELQKEFEVCPYHFIRTMFHRYNVVLMPYKYLLNQRMRRLFGIKLKGNIIIMDEAHNAEAEAEDGESFDIEHYKMPKGLVKKLQLERKRKYGLVNKKAFDKLDKITTALNDKTNKGNDDTFIYDLQARIRRVTCS